MKTQDHEWVLSGSLGSSRIDGVTGILFVLLGYWYKNSGVMNLLEKVAEDVTDWSDPTLDILDRGVGTRLLRNSNFFADFLEFVKKDSLGSFILNQPSVQHHLQFGDQSFGYTRMAIDLGRELRSSSWWKAREKDIKRDRSKSRVIMSVQDE